MENWTDPDPETPRISHQQDYFSCLTAEQRAWCERRLAQLQVLDPKTGRRAVVSRRVALRNNVVAGRVGNSTWGWSMWGKSGRAWQEKHGVAYHFTAEDTKKAHATIKANRVLRKQGWPV